VRCEERPYRAHSARVAVTVAVSGPGTRRIGARRRRFRCYKMVPGAGFEPAVHGFTDRIVSYIAVRSRLHRIENGQLVSISSRSRPQMFARVAVTVAVR